MKLRLDLLRNFNYSDYFDNQLQLYKSGIIFCWVSTFIVTIYNLLANYTFPEIIFLVLLIIQIIMWNKFSRSAFEKYYFIMMIVIYSYRIRQLVLQAESSNETLVYFLRGYTYGFLESFLFFTQPRLMHSLIMAITFILVKIVFMKNYLLSQVVTIILLDLCFLICKLFMENDSRGKYVELKEKNEFLQKFKDIIDKNLPSGIVILSLATQKVQFANSYLRSLFDCENDLQVPEKISSVMINDSGPGRSIMTNETENLNTERNNIYIKTPTFPFDLQDSNKTSCSFFSMEKNKVLIFEAYSFPILWEGEQSKGVFITDITHQIEITELKISNQNKEMAISTVAHELRNPLSGIDGMVELLAEQDLPGVAKKQITTIKTIMKYLLNLLNTILDLQQIKSNKLKLNYSSFTLGNLLDDIKSIFEFQCKEKGIFFKLDYETIKEDFELTTDRERLAQVLINLCANAIKFTLRGGITIAVQFLPDLDSIRFKVTDTGVGISFNDQDNLFQAFGKIDSTSTMNKHGVGLGLIISNSLVKILNSNCMRKKIEVESQEGIGTTFYFDLEIASSKNETETKSEIGFEFEHSYKNSLRDSEYFPSFLNRNNSILSSRVLKSQKISKDLIIIVDDSPFNMIALKHNIEKSGYKCLTALNGQEAIELIMVNSQRLSKVFMDLEMPVMDGIEATQKLIKLMDEGFLSKFDIIGLSGQDDENTVKNCLKSGMSAFLKKPYNFKEIESILKMNILPP